MKNVLYIAVLITLWGCNGGSGTEKHQGGRTNIVHVREKVREIDLGDVLIGSIAPLYIIHDYLVICDYRSNDELIHIFDRNSFTHLGSTGSKGQGPGEIANIGHIEAGENRRFYVTDHGKQKIFDYDMDSVLTNPLYMPDVKMTLNAAFFPGKYHYMNDTLSMGLIIRPVSNSAFEQSMAKVNFLTGEITPMPWRHPDIERKRVCFAVSEEHDIYVECYHHHDLMTVCSLGGDLKYNVYGRKWNDRMTNRFFYYGDVAFYRDKIIASFSDGKDSDPATGNNSPTQFLVFNTSGDYIRTLETGYPILRFCIDTANSRIIMSLDAEIQFASLSLDGLVE
jgi:hypothetical protein